MTFQNFRRVFTQGMVSGLHRLVPGITAGGLFLNALIACAIGCLLMNFCAA